MMYRKNSKYELERLGKKQSLRFIITNKCVTIHTEEDDFSHSYFNHEEQAWPNEKHVKLIIWTIIYRTLIFISVNCPPRSDFSPNHLLIKWPYLLIQKSTAYVRVKDCFRRLSNQLPITAYGVSGFFRRLWFWNSRQQLF